MGCRPRALEKPLFKNWPQEGDSFLVDACENLSRSLPNDKQADYWNDAEVWLDIRSAYEKFFKLNPAAAYRNKYALYAYRCGRWDPFLKQVELLGPALDYKVFGGQAQFEQMFQDAKDQVARKK